MGIEEQYSATPILHCPLRYYEQPLTAPQFMHL